MSSAKNLEVEGPRQSGAAGSEGMTMTRAHVDPARALRALVVFGALSAAWAAYLWWELVLARTTGSSPFCSISGSMDCGKLWDLGFASEIHELTGVPIAGWGVVWGLAAAAIAWVARRGGEPKPERIAAVLILALVGLVSVVGLASLSLAAKTLCLGCLATYCLVGAYGLGAVLRLRHLAAGGLARGIAISASATAAFFALALFPGRATPRSVERISASAVDKLSSPKESATLGLALEDVIAQLDPQALQLLSDSIAAYRAGPELELIRPRAVHGPREAKVRILEFTDVLCAHCSMMRRDLVRILEAAPDASVSIEERSFPLDQSCNPRVAKTSKDGLSCLGARARICVEQEDGAFQLATELFRNQSELTREKILDWASGVMPRKQLEACLESKDVAWKLEEDIGLGISLGLTGTPFVLVNGRRAPSFGPFLITMILAEGNLDHPALSNLPPPSPSAAL